MHLLPLLLIPIVAYILFSAKTLGLNADVPPDPQQRVSQFASRALANLKVELAGVRDLQLLGERLRYLKGEESVELWSEGGRIHRQVGAGAARQGDPLGREGTLRFEMDGPVLVCRVTACEDGAEKMVLMRLHPSSH